MNFCDLFIFFSLTFVVAGKLEIIFALLVQDFQCWKLKNPNNYYFKYFSDVEPGPVLCSSSNQISWSLGSTRNHQSSQDLSDENKFKLLFDKKTFMEINA